MSHIFGIISYIPRDKIFTANRIKNHRKQLDWLRTFIQPEDTVLRIENLWENTEEYQCLLNDPICTNRIQIDVPRYPGANRNELLRFFYDSDFDWLICMDDDRALYDYYEGTQFFTKELDSTYGIQLASQGVLIRTLSPIEQPFKKDCASWKYREQSWYMEKVTPHGFLQICCIPNLVKYGYDPIYFNGDTNCQEGQPPEDLQFELDWIIAKHGIAMNKNLIMKEFGGDTQSTLYPTKEYRARVQKYHTAWVKEYLSAKFPKNPKIRTKAALNRAYNTYKQEMFPRGVPWDNRWEEI